MRRPAFYSRSPRGPQGAAVSGAPEIPGTSDTSDSPDASEVLGTSIATPPASIARRRWQPGRRSFAALLVLCVGLGAGGALLWPHQGMRTLTQKDIDAAVLRTLQTTTLPSPAAKAADIIRPSVVRVVGYGTEKTTPEAKTEKRGRNLAKGKPPEAPPDEGPGQLVERGVGTGVVIVDKDIILTNLHVVAGAESIHVTFADGLGVARHRDRRAARERPRGAPGAGSCPTTSSRPRCVRPRTSSPATRSRRSAFRSVSGRRSRRAWSRV